MATLSEAKEAGLFHPRCGHSATPYFPSMGQPKQKSTRQQRIEAELYDKKQRLNQINRNVRKWQDRKIAIAGSATEEQKKLIDARIKQWRKASRDYATQNNLKNYNLPKTVTWSG